jgi:hypothetical protein
VKTGEELKDEIRVPLTQSAEPPLWLVDPPGAFGFENPVEPPGAEAPPPLADAWEADPDQ